jgi:hypothetical protein
MSTLQQALLSTSLVSTTCKREYEDHERRVRVCNGKTRYATIEDAIRHHAECPLEFYHCGICGNWHRTKIYVV